MARLNKLTGCRRVSELSIIVSVFAHQLLLKIVSKSWDWGRARLPLHLLHDASQHLVVGMCPRVSLLGDQHSHKKSCDPMIKMHVWQELHNVYYVKGLTLWGLESKGPSLGVPKTLLPCVHASVQVAVGEAEEGWWVPALSAGCPSCCAAQLMGGTARNAC